MFRRLSLAVVGLVAALAAAGCAASTGTGWVGSTGAGSSTTGTVSGETTSSTAGSSPAPLSSTTTTQSPGPVPSSTTAGTLAEAVGCPAGSDTRCEDNTAAGSSYLQANVAGGTYGFRFVRLGGGVVASLNPEQVFYPASSLKVLQHLHALRWAAAQPDPAEALATPIPVYEDSCSGEGTFWTEPLAEVLEAMMVRSDNQRANAVQDYFGLAAINATAVEVVGTSDTLLAHRFGCGGPGNDPANRSTARDLSQIYERLGLGEVLDAEAAAVFTGLMLGPLWPTLEAAVAAEGEVLGVEPATVEAFRAGIELAYKAGWWDTNLSIGGMLRLPAACGGEPRRAYAFAVFVNGADAVAGRFDVSDVVAVVLEEEIRTALVDYSACGG